MIYTCILLICLWPKLTNLEIAEELHIFNVFQKLKVKE